MFFNIASKISSLNGSKSRSDDTLLTVDFNLRLIADNQITFGENASLS